MMFRPIVQESYRSSNIDPRAFVPKCQKPRFSRDQNGVPGLTARKIEEIAAHFLCERAPGSLRRAVPTPLISILDGLQRDGFCTYAFDQDLGLTSTGERSLGRYSISRKHIDIDTSLAADDPRFPFTCAHELAHFYLHGRVNAQALGYHESAIQDSATELLTFRLDKARPRTILEWQANRFAAALLIPAQTLPHAVVEIQEAMGITRKLGRVFLDNQRQNRADYRRILDRLSNRFATSHHVTRLRLKETGLLVVDPSYGPTLIADTLGDVLTALFRPTET
jgi:Zn-dependent peptidase ImmA (M78 family)